MENQHISESHYYDLIETINEDSMFFDKKKKIIRFSDIESELEGEEYKRIDKILADYFVSIWIHGDSTEKFYDEFVAYMAGNKKCISEIERKINNGKVDKFWIQSGLSSAEYQLHELGFFEDKNKFRNCTLEEIIRKGAVSGSFEAVTLAASYIKLANHEMRDIDIESLAYAWTVYFEHKDYSVFTIYKAFIVFETEGMLEEDESFEIISRLMEQSDKGISHMLTNYVNQKGGKYVKKLIDKGCFSDKNCLIRFWELEPALLDCFGKDDVAEQLTELLSIHYQTKVVEYRDIANSMESKYKNMVLDGIEYYDYQLLSPTKDILPELDVRGIKYLADSGEPDAEHVPLQHGCIHEEDFDYIKEKGMDCLDVAKYTDGWYSCLPYVEAFAVFGKNKIQQKYLQIVHEAMFARCPDGTYIGDWHLLIGNIIHFLQIYEIEIDYQKLYKILIEFLDISLIWHQTKLTCM